MQIATALKNAPIDVNSLFDETNSDMEIPK